MTKLQALEQEIETLSPEEVSELRVWLDEREAEAWDREIERDAASGKLDKLFDVRDLPADNSAIAPGPYRRWQLAGFRPTPNGAHADSQSLGHLPRIQQIFR